MKNVYKKGCMFYLLDCIILIYEYNNEISINYVMIEKWWNVRSWTNVVVDNICVYNIVFDIISENENFEVKSIEERW